jgi:hypothetical protein
VASHFYSAYPDATTTIVLSSLELDAKLRDFRARTQGMDPATFARAWQAFLTDAQRCL